VARGGETRRRETALYELVVALAREPRLSVARAEALLGVRLDPEEGCAAGPVAGWSALLPAGPIAIARLSLPRDPRAAAGATVELRLREDPALTGSTLVTRFGEPVSDQPATPALRAAIGVSTTVTYRLWRWDVAFGVGPAPGDRLKTVSMREEPGG
jgi:hypothetical protein